MAVDSFYCLNDEMRMRQISPVDTVNSQLLMTVHTMRHTVNRSLKLTGSLKFVLSLLYGYMWKDDWLMWSNSYTHIPQCVSTYSSNTSSISVFQTCWHSWSVQGVFGTTVYRTLSFVSVDAHIIIVIFLGAEDPLAFSLLQAINERPITHPNIAVSRHIVDWIMSHY